MTEPRAAVAVILAAGQGVRMKSRRPKVLHELCGLPMLAFVLDAMQKVGVGDTVVVIGYGADEVRRRFADRPVKWVEQTEQKGTGHAVMVAAPVVGDFAGDVIVACGDNPLLTPETVTRVLEHHRTHGASCTVVTAEAPDPTGYGRIVRSTDGSVDRIVEERDATAEQKAVREINSGNYVFDCRSLFDALQHIRPDNRQKEYLLTDVVAVLRSAGRKVMSYPASDPTEVLGINSRAQLASAGRILQERIQARLMSAGVTILDPRNTYLDPRVEVGPDTVICPFTVILGPVTIGSNCRIGPFAYLRGPLRLEDGAEAGGFREMRGTGD